MTLKANGKPRHIATFTTLTGKEKIKTKVTVEVFDYNMGLDQELLAMLSRYHVVHGGLYWKYEQEHPKGEPIDN